MLADPAHQLRSYFYFREPLAYHDMPRNVADPTPGANDRAMKLAALKRNIEQTLPKRVRSYAVGWDEKRQAVTGLEAWGRNRPEFIIEA